MATAAEVTNLYYQLLGRAPDPAGLEYWLNSGQPISTIARDIAIGQEAQQFLTQRPQEQTDPSLGRWVTYNADQGAVWEPYAYVPQLGQYITYDADLGGQFEQFNDQQRAAIAQQIGEERKAAIQRAAEYVAANPLAMTGNLIETKSGDLRDVSYFNPIVQPGQAVTGSTLTQLTDPVTKDPIFLSNPNDPYSYTYTDTGIPAIGGTVEQQAAMYQPIQDKGVFGTIGGDLLSAVKDPYFHNFAMAAAAMAAAAALAPAIGSGLSGAVANPLAGDIAAMIAADQAALGAGGLGAGGLSGLGATDFGSFIAADAAASAAGQGAFDLAAALGMPLDQAVTAGLINGAGNLTSAGASALLNASSAAAGSTGSTAGGFLGGSGDVLTGAVGSGGGALGTTGAATGAGSLINAGKELLTGTSGDLIKAGLAAGTLVAANALAPKQETTTSGGLTAAQLQAMVAGMPSMIGQYVSQAEQAGMGQTGQGYTPAVAQAISQLFPTFTLPATGLYGAGRFGQNYNPTPATSLV